MQRFGWTFCLWSGGTAQRNTLWMLLMFVFLQFVGTVCRCEHGISPETHALFPRRWQSNYFTPPHHLSSAMETGHPNYFRFRFPNISCSVDSSPSQPPHINHTNPMQPASRPSLHPTACKNCRKRGRKCDRTLPACLSCGKRNVSCDGYVTRWPGVAARGKLAGKSRPVVEEVSGFAIPTRSQVERELLSNETKRPNDNLLDMQSDGPSASPGSESVTRVFTRATQHGHLHDPLSNCIVSEEPTHGLQRPQETENLDALITYCTPFLTAPQVYLQ